MSQEFLQDVSLLCSSLPGVSPSVISSILDKYSCIPESLCSRSSVWKLLEEACPLLFCETFVRSGGDIVSLQEQEQKRGEILASVRSYDLVSCLNKTVQTLHDYQDFLDTFRQQLLMLFPEEHFLHTFRVKDIAQNFVRDMVASPRWATDVVGIRIVPRDIRVFPSGIAQFEQTFADDILFKLNTFPWTDSGIVQKIGPFSMPYRAIHYYLPFGQFCMEIQFHTPAIDCWSALHHDTVYKPKVFISPSFRDAIMDFGERCCVVDAFELSREMLSA